jgi:hypothetical protein
LCQPHQELPRLPTGFRIRNLDLNYSLPFSGAEAARQWLVPLASAAGLLQLAGRDTGRVAGGGDPTSLVYDDLIFHSASSFD